MEVESMASGVLRKVLVNAGETVPVGQLLAVIGGAEEDISRDAGRTAARPRPRPPGKLPRRKRNRNPSCPRKRPGPGKNRARRPHGRAGSCRDSSRNGRTGATFRAHAGLSAGERILASPLARRLARDAGVDLSSIQGSGPGGRIIRRDVEGAASAPGPVRVPRVMPSPQGPEYRDEPLSSMRKIIAPAPRAKPGPGSPFLSDHRSGYAEGQRVAGVGEQGRTRT